MKEKNVVLERFEDIYLKKIYQNTYLSSIVDIFLDSSSFWKNVCTRLHTSGSRGAMGNGIEITFEGREVIIEPIWYEGLEDTSDCAVSVDRDVLLRLMDRWKEVIKDRPEFITFTLEDDGEISVVGS